MQGKIQQKNLYHGCREEWDGKGKADVQGGSAGKASRRAYTVTGL